MSEEGLLAARELNIVWEESTYTVFNSSLELVTSFEQSSFLPIILAGL